MVTGMCVTHTGVACMCFWQNTAGFSDDFNENTPLCHHLVNNQRVQLQSWSHKHCNFSVRALNYHKVIQAYEMVAYFDFAFGCLRATHD